MPSAQSLLVNFCVHLPFNTYRALTAESRADLGEHLSIHVQGPGDNATRDDPYVQFTGRTFNNSVVAGLMRIKQGVLSLHG